MKPVEMPVVAATGQSDQDCTDVSQAAKNVARTLQQWLSQGRTLEESLVSLLTQTRQNKAAAGRSLTPEVVRVGLRLWRCRQQERAALRSSIQTWYAQQPRTHAAIADGKLRGLSTCCSPRRRSGGRAAADNKKATFGADGAAKKKKGLQCKEAAGAKNDARQAARVCGHASSVESLAAEISFCKSDEQQLQQKRKQRQKMQPEQEPTQVPIGGSQDLQLDGPATAGPLMASSLTQPTTKALPTNATSDSVREALCQRRGFDDVRFGPLDFMAMAPSVCLLAQMPGPLGSWLTGKEAASEAGTMHREDGNTNKYFHPDGVGTPPKNLSKRRRFAHGSTRSAAQRLDQPPTKLKGLSGLPEA